MLNHEADSVAVQLQLLAVVTEMLALPPAAGIVTFVGATVNVHDEAACVTVTDCAATVSVAERAVGVVLGSAV
jgi:hypothetical protein